MKTFLSMLRVPLTLEAANVLIHRIAYWANLGSTYLDTASTVIFAAIVFCAGWVVSRQTRRLVPAMLSGLILWALSLVLAAFFMTMELCFERGLPDGEGATAMAGFVLSSILFLPAVIAVAAIAALIARRTAP